MKQETRRNNTKQKILKTAFSEFAVKGFDGSRVDEIANIAGVNKQRIYEYFGNKEGLYRAILEENYQLIIKEEQYFMQLTEAEIPELPRQILTLYFNFHRKYPRFWRILAWENLHGGKYSQKLHKMRERSFSHLMGLYKKGQQQNIFKNGVSFESFIFTLTSISFFYFSNQATMSKTLNKKLSDRKVANQIISEALAMMGF